MTNALRIALALAAGIALGVLAAHWLYTPPDDTAALRDGRALAQAVRAEQARADSLGRLSARAEQNAAAVQREADRVRESRDAERDRADRATAGLDALSERAAAETARADRSLAALPAQIAAAQTADSSPAVHTRPPTETHGGLSPAADAYPDTLALCTERALAQAALGTCTAARRALALYADSLHAALDARSLHALHADTGWRLAEARADTLSAALVWQRQATDTQREAAAASLRLADAEARRTARQRDTALGAGIAVVLFALLTR